MPWSEWQDPFQVRSFATPLRLTWTAGGGEAATGSSEDYQSSFVFSEGFYGFTVVGYQFKLQSTWETYRTFPYPMFDLTEGVDYIEVPGEPGVYYEYESGPNIFDGWDASPLVLSVVDDEVTDRDFEMRLEAGTTYVAGPLDDFDPDLGTPIGGWDGTTPIGTAVATPDPGPALSFSVWPSQPPLKLDEPNAYEMRLPYVATAYLIQLPRWRYWKPGILPLRQYPRNDGLRGGAPAAKPTSRQGSTARRTYL